MFPNWSAVSLPCVKKYITLGGLNNFFVKILIIMEYKYDC